MDDYRFETVEEVLSLASETLAFSICRWQKLFTNHTTTSKLQLLGNRATASNTKL